MGVTLLRSKRVKSVEMTSSILKLKAKFSMNILLMKIVDDFTCSIQSSIFFLLRINQTHD
jgi:hypothetical protein